MRHLHASRKLGVDAPHRKALMRSLTLALIEKEAIQTTPARAKELRWYADRAVTLAKRGDLSCRRHLVKLLGSTKTKKGVPNRIRAALSSLYSKLAPRFKDRNGGYTQIFRLAERRLGDNAEQCIIRYLPPPDEKKSKVSKKAKKPIKKTKEEVKASPKTADKNGKVKGKARGEKKEKEKEKEKDKE